MREEESWLCMSFGSGDYLGKFGGGEANQNILYENKVFSIKFLKVWKDRI